MPTEADKKVKTCERCVRHKAEAEKTARLVNIRTSRPLKLVCMDYLSLEPDGRGTKNNHFTKYAVAVPTTDQKAKTVAKSLWNNFVHYGMPERLHSDQGRDFESAILKRGCGVNDRDGLTDMSLLHYCCKAGAPGIGDAERAAVFAQQLLLLGADPSLRSRWTNMSALHCAAYFDVPQLIKVVLGASQPGEVDATCSDFDFGTALHIAASNLCTSAVKCLLELGANPAFREEAHREHLSGHLFSHRSGEKTVDQLRLPSRGCCSAPSTPRSHGYAQGVRQLTADELWLIAEHELQDHEGMDIEEEEYLDRQLLGDDDDEEEEESAPSSSPSSTR
ncbi:hypothetical protein ACEWY4_005936 [Coilia grayii]|uniref:Integrase catalytic domain-containing protein n=1 Tax=Coilia grayii TaxID=363190 RepID=A0ABD1KKE0_9TELE